MRVDDLTDTATAAATAATAAGGSDDRPDLDQPEKTVDETHAESGEPTHAEPPSPPRSIDDTGEFSFDDWTMPPERPRSAARWIIPLVLLVAVIVVWTLVFLDRGSTTTTVALATTTSSTTTTTQAPTTTQASTTTSSTTTTTTVAFPAPDVWPPIGDPIPTEDLTLKAAGVGPLDIGSGIGEVAGRLTASLGTAEASGVDEFCSLEAGYWLQWGELRAIFDGSGAGSAFVAYRYEDLGSENSLGLTTLSGLALGDTVEDLERIYASFTITFEEMDGRDVFRLMDGAEVLLWGPVTSTDPDGIVTGIYSPGPCVDA